jgi:hypothetical protein
MQRREQIEAQLFFAREKWLIPKISEPACFDIDVIL